MVAEEPTTEPRTIDPYLPDEVTDTQKQALEDAWDLLDEKDPESVECRKLRINLAHLQGDQLLCTYLIVVAGKAKVKQLMRLLKLRDRKMKAVRAAAQLEAADEPVVDVDL